MWLARYIFTTNYLCFHWLGMATRAWTPPRQRSWSSLRMWWPVCAQFQFSCLVFSISDSVFCLVLDLFISDLVFVSCPGYIHSRLCIHVLSWMYPVQISLMPALLSLRLCCLIWFLYYHPWPSHLPTIWQAEWRFLCLYGATIPYWKRFAVPNLSIVSSHDLRTVA